MYPAIGWAATPLEQNFLTLFRLQDEDAKNSGFCRISGLSFYHRFTYFFAGRF